MGQGKTCCMNIEKLILIWYVLCKWTGRAQSALRPREIGASRFLGEGFQANSVVIAIRLRIQFFRYDFESFILLTRV